MTPVKLREQVCRDRDDDKFIEAALAAGARTLIARDADLTILGKPFGFTTPGALLQAAAESACGGYPHEIQRLRVLGAKRCGALALDAQPKRSTDQSPIRVNAREPHILRSLGTVSRKPKGESVGLRGCEWPTKPTDQNHQQRNKNETDTNLI